MYKVFIDHKPIIFIEKELCIAESKQIEFQALLDLKDNLKGLMENVSITNPLYITCRNSEVEFKLFFKEYKKVRAAGGIVQRKKKFLVIKRNGMWDIPKGKIEKGESKKLAAVREIEEECGITGPVIEKFITKTYHIFNDKGRKAIKKTYWYYMTYDGPKELKPQLLEGIKKAKWMTRDEMLAIRGRTYGSINELLDTFEVSF